jgi:hypothetical protein
VEKAQHCADGALKLFLELACRKRRNWEEQARKSIQRE